MFEYSGRKPTTPQEHLVYWIQEREKIRLKKEQGLPKPWSDDPVFQRTYFCNVSREDDRVTKWIRDNWSPTAIGWENYEYAMVLARFLNWPETLDYLDATKGIPSPEVIHKWLVARAELVKCKIWGNAYVITSHGLKMPKVAYLCERVLPAAYELLGAGRWQGAYALGPNTLAARHAQLMQLEGLGSFLAAQVIADLKNTKGHPLEEAPDWFEWSAPGPGSLRGLTWYFGESQARFFKYEKLINIVFQGVQQFIPDLQKVLRGGMQDLQNCLCEYDKYMRVLNGTGRSKRKYPGVE
jgi:hypothetical protein